MMTSAGTPRSKKESAYILRITFSPKQAVFILATALLSLLAGGIVSEEVTVTSYYPSPVGVYEKMTVTGNALFAQGGGSVGIGKADPSVALDISGSARVSQDTLAQNVKADEFFIAGQSVITEVGCSGTLSCSQSGTALSIGP